MATSPTSDDPDKLHHPRRTVAEEKDKGDPSLPSPYETKFDIRPIAQYGATGGDKTTSKPNAMNDPYWKVALNWGVVITFLTLPLVLMTIQLYLLANPSVITDAPKYKEHFKYLAEFQRNLTILVFGLAGLRTWEQIKNGKNERTP